MYASDRLPFGRVVAVEPVFAVIAPVVVVFVGATVVPFVVVVVVPVSIPVGPVAAAVATEFADDVANELATMFELVVASWDVITEAVPSGVIRVGVTIFVVVAVPAAILT